MDDRPAALEDLLRPDEPSKPKRTPRRSRRWWLIGCAVIPLFACALCCFGVALIGRAATGLVDDMNARYAPLMADGGDACNLAVRGDVASSDVPLGRTLIFAREGREGLWLVDAWLMTLYSLTTDSYIGIDPLSVTSFTCIVRETNRAAHVYVMDRTSKHLIAERQFPPAGDTVLWDTVDDWLRTLR